MNLEDIVLPHHSEFSVYEHPDSFMVVHPDRTAWFRFARELLPGFMLLDGTSSVRELRERASQCLPLPIRAAALQLIADIAKGLPHTLRREPRPRAVALLYLVLTDQCNSRCIYCFRDPQNRPSAVSLQAWKDALDALRHVGTPKPTVVYTGGEPTLSPHLLPLAQYARESGRYRNVLQTNGLRLRPQHLHPYVELFDTIQFSLDSLDTPDNDYLRGAPGHGERIRRLLDALSTADVTVRLSATITKRNAAALLAIPRAYPQVRFTYTPMLQIGRGAARPELAFTPKEFETLLASMPENDPALIPRHLPEAGLQRAICGAGVSVLSIGPTGEVYPCQMLHAPRFSCGNIGRAPLETIYSESAVLRSFAELTVDDLAVCRRCEIRNLCAGGCLANGFWARGRFPSRDAFCSLNKQLYLLSMLRSCSPEPVCSESVGACTLTSESPTVAQSGSRTDDQESILARSD